MVQKYQSWDMTVGILTEEKIIMSKNAEVTALQENEMGTLPVGKLLRKMALPLIFSMFVQYFLP